MCTAMSYHIGGGYFGRTLDLEYTYDEAVTFTPENYIFSLRLGGEMRNHYALLGMAVTVDGYPLYYDAMNGFGLCMAGLNFPQSAVYAEATEGMVNLASFELIPYLLGRCKTVAEARQHLEKICVCNISFNELYPASPLHWMLADKTESVVVEACREGFKVYENPVGVMANEPPFPHQLTHLRNFGHLTCQEPENGFFPGWHEIAGSRGSGALGLPGDYSSPSRFVRASYVLANAVSPEGEDACVEQFFGMLGSVEVPAGSVRLPDGRCVITHYTCCMSGETGIYYYKTVGNSRICGVNMKQLDLDGEELLHWTLRRESDFFIEMQAI